MSSELNTIPVELSSMPDSKLKASLLPNPEKDIATMGRIEKHISEAKLQTEVAESVMGDIVIEQNRSGESKKVILGQLEEVDKEIKMQLSERKFLAEALRDDLRILDSSKFSDQIAELLLDYVRDCPERQKEIISRIQRDIRKKNFDRARLIIGELIVDLESTDLQWKDIVSSTDLPPEIIDNIDFITEGISLRNCLQIIADNEEILSNSGDLLAVRSKSFESLIEQGYPPDTILDLIEGRYDLDDPAWGGNLIESYLPINEFIQKNSMDSKTSLRTRIILVGFTAMLASGFLLGGGAPLPQSADSVTGRIIPTLVQPDQSGQPESSEESSSEEGSPATQGEMDIEGSEAGGDGQEESEGPPGIQDEYSPENSGELGKGIFWEIEGQVPEGYFRESVSNKFSWSRWKMDTGESNQFYSANLSAVPVESPTRLTSIFPVGQVGERFTIPVPDDWEITYVQVGSETQGVINVSRSRDGSYVAETMIDLEAPQTLTVGLRPIESGQDNWENAPNLDASLRETIQIDYLIGDAEKINQETLNFLNEIRDNDSLSTEDKAMAVNNFVKDHFIYSLDKDYSDFYLEDRASGEYVGRAWQVGYGDCDVVNTVNVAFLRYVGIDARLATGFANSSSLLSVSRRTLEGSEKHGWAQFFNNDTETWEDADATPGVVDPGSLDELMNLNGGLGIEQIFSISSIRDLLKTMGLVMAKTADFATSELGIVSQILSILSIYGILYGAGSRLQSKNQQKLGEISNILRHANDGPDWKPHNKLADSISRIVRMVISSKSNYLSGKEANFFSKILLFPRLIKARKDKELINPIADVFGDTREMGFNPKKESLPSFISRIVGIKEERVTENNIREHSRSALRHTESDFNASVHAAFSKSLLHHNKNRGIAPYEISLFKAFKDHQLSEAMFIDAVLGQLYKQYLAGIKRLNRKRTRLLRRKSSAAEARDTMRPKGEEIRIFATPKPINKLEFIKIFAPEIPSLLKYHEVSKFILKTKESKTKEYES